MAYFVVVGSGAREYAIVRRLKEENIKTFSIQGARNDALSELADASITVSDYRAESIMAALQGKSIECVLLSSEAPIYNGTSDILRQKGFPVLGASKEISKYEKDKLAARKLARIIDEQYLVKS